MGIELCEVFVYRYELPGIRALNFVIGDSLGGGGVASLRIDPQVNIGIYYRPICSEIVDTCLTW